MKPEGSLPCSQEPATWTSHEPDKSSTLALPSSWKSILILSCYLRLGLPSGSFPGFPCPNLSSLQYMLHAPPISFFPIWSPNNDGWEVQIIKLPITRYPTGPCHLVPLGPKYLPQLPLFEYLSFCCSCDMTNQFTSIHSFRKYFKLILISSSRFTPRLPTWYRQTRFSNQTFVNHCFTPCFSFYGTSSTHLA